MTGTGGSVPLPTRKRRLPTPSARKRAPARLPEPGRPGFSLIEIFVVVLVIGIMTGIAIPKIRNMKRRAYIGTMVTDLRNLAMDQESWWSITDAYTTNLSLLEFIPTQA
ncbi:MAG: type IV pilin protein [Gemmatimonadaceae bacterium]